MIMINNIIPLIFSQHISTYIYSAHAKSHHFYNAFNFYKCVSPFIMNYS